MLQLSLSRLVDAVLGQEENVLKTPANSGLSIPVKTALFSVLATEQLYLEGAVKQASQTGFPSFTLRAQHLSCPDSGGTGVFHAHIP